MSQAVMDQQAVLLGVQQPQLQVNRSIPQQTERQMSRWVEAGEGLVWEESRPGQ